MISDLDKYGLVALTVIIVLILFIAINDFHSDSDPNLSGILFDDSQKADESPLENDVVVVIRDTDTGSTSSEDFDFSEGPVKYPGSPVERERTVPGGGEEFTIHRVKKGENLSSISRKYYGTVTRWKSIAAANPGVDSTHLSVGQRLRVPLQASLENGTIRGRSGESRTVSQEQVIRYRVRKGDTLGKIARRFYGTEGKWERILTANQRAIPNPKRLQIGTMLEIPR